METVGLSWYWKLPFRMLRKPIWTGNIKCFETKLKSYFNRVQTSFFFITLILSKRNSAGIVGLSRLRSTCPEFDSNTFYFGQYETRNCDKRSEIVPKDSKEPREALKTFWYTYDKSIQRFAEIWSKLLILVRISDMSHFEVNLESQSSSQFQNAASIAR